MRDTLDRYYASVQKFSGTRRRTEGTKEFNITGYDKINKT